MTLEFKTPNKKNPAPFIRYFSFSIEQAYTDTYTELYENFADNGGAIAIIKYFQVFIENITFQNNKAMLMGGAIYIED